MTIIYSIQSPEQKENCVKIYDAVKEGKSRFGWDDGTSLEAEEGVKAYEIRMKQSRLHHLLNIQKGDLIIHRNIPTYGKCIAARADGGYQHDEGFPVTWGSGRDFGHYIPIDQETIVEFNRNDSNILPNVSESLKKQGAIYRIWMASEEDFEISFKNLKEGTHTGKKKEETARMLLSEELRKTTYPKLIELIQKMYKGKDLEHFFHNLFNNIPHVVSVQNGSGWRPDHGADLKVAFFNPLLNEELLVVVQVKSYTGAHIETRAVEQLATGIEKYEAAGGLLLTTGELTEELEHALEKKQKEIGKSLQVLSGDELARFVLKYAPEIML